MTTIRYLSVPESHAGRMLHRRIVPHLLQAGDVVNEKPGKDLHNA